jgi:hypothetical protein
LRVLKSTNPMAIGSHTIETLRRKLSDDRDLSKIWEYFLDRFASDPEFRSAGEPRAAPELEVMLELVGRSVWGKARTEVRIGSWLEVREYSLIHGTCMVERFPASALYFPDLGKGVEGLHTSSATEMVWARFSLRDLAGMPTTSPTQ